MSPIVKSENIEVRVYAVTFEAPGVHSFELRPVQGKELPPFTAGAHIDLHLPNGMLRSYSLANSQDETHRYVVGVNKAVDSRGGSKYMHETLHVGDTFSISPPRNNFELVEDAPHVVFIAGGIGITPLWCMIQRLEKLRKSWSLYYCARSRLNAGFLRQLQGLRENVHFDLHFNFDDESGGNFLDLNEVVKSAPPGSHLYCCGPIKMLEAFEKACEILPSENVHVEYFSTSLAPAAAGGFFVELARSGGSVFVSKGETILDALLDQGINIPYSCAEGICGSCEVKVLEGIPDHRDVVLSKAAHAANKSMMVCCSGCKSEKLVLDL